MKIISIVGARPEFIQAAPITRAIQDRPGYQEILVHTGQHYDYLMSQAFFDELGIPVPDYNLGVGSGRHGQQTAAMLAQLECLFLAESPDLVMVRGDTNSTIAAVLAAAKLGILTAHVEAGERSYDRRMPEEINRVVADAISDIHLCASRTSVARLAEEGITRAVHWVGDVMYDAMLQHLPMARHKSDVLNRLGLVANRYVLVTIHRAANTDDPARLATFVECLNRAGEPVVFPIHPRTRQALQRMNAQFAHHVIATAPMSYFDMVVLEENARLIATDSGGVQREAYFLSRPCITLREETEWTETVEAGWNLLVGADPEKIESAWRTFKPSAAHPSIFGDGCAASAIVDAIEHEYGSSYQLKAVQPQMDCRYEPR